MTKSNKKELSPEQLEELLSILKARFEKNKNHYKGIEWDKVQTILKANPDKLWSLNEIERTGGELDVAAKWRSCYTFHNIGELPKPSANEMNSDAQ